LYNWRSRSPAQRGFIQKEEWRLLWQYQGDLFPGKAPGGCFRGGAGDLVIEKLVELAEGANFAEFLILDMQFQDFLDGKDDFEKGQRVQPDVFDEAGVIIRPRKVYGRRSGLVAVENPEDDGRDGVDITRFPDSEWRLRLFPDCTGAVLLSGRATSISVKVTLIKNYA